MRQLEIIDYEIKLLRDTKEKLTTMLAKKGKTHEHITILSETLEFTREREQELFNERSQIEATTGSTGDNGRPELAQNNA